MNWIQEKFDLAREMLEEYEADGLLAFDALESFQREHFEPALAGSVDSASLLAVSLHGA